MTIPQHPHRLSPKRYILCSRDHAQCIAGHMVDEGTTCVSVVRTGSPLQPVRVVPDCVDGVDVELEVRVA